MQSAAKRSRRLQSGPGRARLKLWHLVPPNALSAHLFFGVLCTALQCTGLAHGVDSVDVSRVHSPGGAF